MSRETDVSKITQLCAKQCLSRSCQFASTPSPHPACPSSSFSGSITPAASGCAAFPELQLHLSDLRVGRTASFSWVRLLCTKAEPGPAAWGSSSSLRQAVAGSHSSQDPCLPGPFPVPRLCTLCHLPKSRSCLSRMLAIPLQGRCTPAAPLPQEIVTDPVPAPVFFWSLGSEWGLCS